MSIRVCGKAIITGEHSVLRGGQAVVFPVYHKYLEMETKTKGDVKLLKGFQPIEQKILQRALDICGRSVTDLEEDIFIKNLLVGGGLGSSAAFCVALGRFILSKGWFSSEHLFDYCKQLESFFHGESSGLDIAILLREVPISYQIEEGAKPLSLKWHPHFFVSFSGQQSTTYKNIQTVQKKGLHQSDQKMSRASSKVIQAFAQNETDGQPLLIEAMTEAYSCFEDWSLITDVLQWHINQCKKDGALAVKPTGSGGGGHVLSLFASKLSESNYTPVFVSN